MYKIKNAIAPQHVSELFLKHSKHYKLSNNDFPIPAFNSVKYDKHSLRYMGPIYGEKLIRN